MSWLQRAFEAELEIFERTLADEAEAIKTEATRVEQKTEDVSSRASCSPRFDWRHGFSRYSRKVARDGTLELQIDVSYPIARPAQFLDRLQTLLTAAHDVTHTWDHYRTSVMDRFDC